MRQISTGEGCCRIGVEGVEESCCVYEGCVRVFCT